MILEIFKKWNQIIVEVVQPTIISSSRSMLSRDKRLPLNTWNSTGLQETFLAINPLRLIHRQIILKEFNLTTCNENVEWSLEMEGRTVFAQVRTDKKKRHNSNADICDKAVDYELYNTSGITAELHGRTAKTANIGIGNSTNSLIHNHF